MGITKYEPGAAHLEFIFPDTSSTSTVFSVRISVPERIVYLPVPEWVIEDIWQGGISGAYHFESDARDLVLRLQEDLAPENNVEWFSPQQAKRRE